MDEEESARVGSSRGRRSNVSSEQLKRNRVLDALKEARLKGKIFKTKVDETEDDLYVEVDEEEYASKRQEERNFVEIDDGDEYYSEEGSSESEGERPSKSKQNSKLKTDSAPKTKKRGTLPQIFQVSKKKSSQVHVNVEDDPDLQESLNILISGQSDLPSAMDDEGEGEETDENRPIDDDILNFNSSWDRGAGGQSGKFAAETPNLRNPYKRFASPVLAPSAEVKVRRVEENIAKNPPLSKPICGEISTSHRTKQSDFREPPPPPPPQTQKSSSPKHVEQEEEAEKFESDDGENDEIIAPDDAQGGVVRFYYLNAFEDAVKHSGTVYLFGRLKASGGADYESCCIVVKNVPRQLFFHKREFHLKTGERVSDDDLRNEVRELLQREFSVTKYKTMVVSKKFLSRNLPFADEITALEVQFNANFGRISADFSGDTFSHVFNTTSTSMERIVVEREIKGPCWMDISLAEKSSGGITHCQNEFILDVERNGLKKCINLAPSSNKFSVPPIRLLSLNIMTALNQEEREQQIVMISMVFDNSFIIDKPYFSRKKLNRCCLVTKLGKNSLPFDFSLKLKKINWDAYVKEALDERILLNAFLSKLKFIKPDMIVAHDWSSQLSLLVARMEKYQSKHPFRNWHFLSRLNRTVPLNQIGRTKFAHWELTAGHLCLDSKSSAEELIRSRSYAMEDLVQQIIKPLEPSVRRLNLSLEEITETFVSSTPKIDLYELIRWNWSEALFSLRIIVQLNAIPLLLFITQIVGGVFSRTLMGGRAERNEFLLLHACKKNQIVAPDKYFHLKVNKASKTTKSSKKESESQVESSTTIVDAGDEELTTAKQQTSDVATSTNKKAQYTGGLVLEPKKGLYETFIVLLDFNSLYPSIIQEFNICFTTVPNAFADVNEANLPQMPGESKPDGILKTEIRELVNRRREVKNLMKKIDAASEIYKQYNIRQMGLKLTANSMYGCLGFPQSRFYAKTLAAMVTFKGREVLTHTRDLVQAEGFSVIYGDTDSIMVNTNSTDMEHAKAVAQKLKQIVNKNYRLLELDIDGIYQKLLLLKKKKYAGLAVDLANENIVTREMKGLDIVRRDWSVLAKEIGDKVVDLILSSADRDEIVEDIRQLLSTLRKNLDEGLVEFGKFEILKQLTRNPNDYQDAKSQPHVLVAKRLNESKKFNFKQGDVIKYVICKDGSDNPATQRAYSLLELKGSSDLSIDVNYYLTQQIHPVVSRLCEPIEEIDAVQIAESLGIDPSLYHRSMMAQSAAANEEEVQFGLEQDFETCEGFSYECAKCGKLNMIRSVLADSKDGVFSLDKCLECSATLAKDQLGAILKRLISILRQQVEKHIQSPFVCDDVTCNAECLTPTSQQWTNEGFVCFKCHQGIMRKTFSSKQLFDQQCFFKSLFDLDTFLASKSTRDKRHRLVSQNGFEAISSAYRKCQTVVERFLALNDFNKVDLSVVFAPLMPSRLALSN